MKLFVFSDVHGFFDEFKKALDNAGFESGNPEHLLVGCGDYFDRGSQPFEMMEYLNSIPNKVLCKGNHEQLIIECIDRGYPKWHDDHNGTTDTIMDFAIHYNKYLTFEEACDIVEKPMKKFIGGLVNYYETNNYIFTHSTVPVLKDWRNAHQKEWDEAMWPNPFDFALKVGFYNPEWLNNKRICFGHWHTSYAHKSKNGTSEFGDDANFDIYYGENCVGIDGCTAYSKKVNILVLEDELLT